MSHGPWKRALQIDLRVPNGLEYDLIIQLLFYPSLAQIFKDQHFFMQKTSFLPLFAEKYRY